LRTPPPVHRLRVGGGGGARAEAPAPTTDPRAARRAELAADLDRLRAAEEEARATARATRVAVREVRTTGTIDEVAEAMAAEQRAWQAHAAAEAAIPRARDALRGFDNLPAATAGRPALEALGERLIVTSDPDAPGIARYLDDLARVHPDTLRELADAGVTVRVDAARRVPDFPGHEHLANERPRGWSEGRTWSEVRGAYSQRTRDVLLGDPTAAGGSSSVALHELGHAVDHVRGLRDLDRAWRAHRADFERIAERGSYFTQGGPGGEAGIAESLAEGFADAHMLLGEGLERVWGERWATIVRRLMGPPGGGPMRPD
jgi:hypothetical protein